jgi:hypothetical protein
MTYDGIYRETLKTVVAVHTSDGEDFFVTGFSASVFEPADQIGAFLLGMIESGLLRPGF